MAAGRGSHDSGDCQQWHAFLTIQSGSRRYRPRCDLDRVPWYLRDLYKLPTYSIQASTSRRYVRFCLFACSVSYWFTVHNMGDAGYILFGPIGREVLSFGTIVFAVFATGGQLLAGQIALGVLSENKLCLMLYTGIFAIPTFLCALPRTLDRLSWLSVPSVISILIAGILGMVGAGINPLPGRVINIVVPTDFVTAFISITNPVFAYAGKALLLF